MCISGCFEDLKWYRRIRKAFVILTGKEIANEVLKRYFTDESLKYRDILLYKNHETAESSIYDIVSMFDDRIVLFTGTYGECMDMCGVHNWQMCGIKDEIL